MNMGMYWLFEYTWVCVFASVCLSVSLRLREDNSSGSAERFLFRPFTVTNRFLYLNIVIATRVGYIPTVTDINVIIPLHHLYDPCHAL